MAAVCSLSPRWSAVASANYHVAISDRLTGFLSGNVTYHGDSYSSFSRAMAFDTYLPEYTLVDAKVGVRTQDGVECTLYGDNLGHEAPYLGVVSSQNGVRVFTARPRTYGLRVRSTF